MIDTLKRVWNFRVNYAPIRLAIGRSLLSGDIPNNEDFPDDNKRAIDTQQIFSGGGTDYTPLFRALIVQRHNRVLSDDEFLHLLKAHVDHGFALIKNDTSGFKSEDDYLVELTRKGLELRTEESALRPETISAFG